MGTKLAFRLGMKLTPAASLLALSAGCPVVPPTSQTTIEVSVEIVSSDFSPQITIDEAFFAIEKINILSDIDVEGNELDVEQIISTQTDVGLLFDDVPPALYSRMRLKLNKPRPYTELPEEFDGDELSFLLVGSAIVEGQEVPLRVQDRGPSPNLNVVFLQAVDLLPGDKAQLVMEGHLSNLFAGVVLDGVQETDLTDGALLIDLKDQPFLNNHPTLEEIAEQLQDNLELTFTVTQR